MSEQANGAKEIAQALNEANVTLIATVVDVIGLERTMAFLGQALEVEAQGGMLTTDGKRRRTPGGVFFHLIKQHIPSAERKAIFPVTRQKKKKRSRTTTTPKVKTPPMTWEEAKMLVGQVIKTPGEARTVKVTLIGRPLKVIAQKDCVVVSLKGKPPKTLPNGLPPIPEGGAITWAVFIVNKQWNKVKASIEANEDDALIIEGYPIVGKNGVAAVMATNCNSVLMERAKREQPKAGEA